MRYIWYAQSRAYHSMTEPKIFCTAPWHSVSIDPQGQKQICCDIRGNTVDESKIKQKFLQGEFPKECAICEKNEKNKLSSSRQRFNQRFLDNDFTYTLDQKDIREIHLDLGNLCNNRCLTCWPIFSTQVHKKWQEIGWIDNPPNYLPKFSNKIHHDTYRDDDFFNEYCEILKSSPNLCRIRFIGGEPLINPQLNQYIDAVSDEQAQNTSVLICTNVSIYDPGLIDKLKRFKQVEFTLSIDAHGSLNEKIRVGSKWATVEENFKKYVALTDDRFKVIVNSTVSLYNVLDLDVLVEWIKDYPVFLNINLVHDPVFLSPLNLPQDWKTLAVRRLTACEKNCKDIKTKVSLKGLLSAINSYQFNHDHWLQFKKYSRNLI